MDAIDFYHWVNENCNNADVMQRTYRRDSKYKILVQGFEGEYTLDELYEIYLQYPTL